MNLEQTLKIHNKFDIRVLDAKSGEIKHEQTAYNIVLDKMYERLLDWMPFFQGIAFGTGSGVPATSDTTLFQYLGWKQMGQTDCGTIKIVRHLPLVSRKRRITLHADAYVGQTITEIGVAYSSSTSTSGDGNTTYGGIVTHAMLSQPILKTELDVIQIDATVYLNFGSYLMSAYDDRVYWGPNGDLIDYFMGNTFPTCKFYASKERFFDNIVNGSSLGATATVSRTEWVKDSLNKKLTTPVRRFDISDANGAIRGIGFGSAGNKGIFGSVFPIPDVFEGYSIEGDSLGTGDGTQTGFDFTWNDVKQTGIEIFVNGAKQTSGFTLEPNRISSSFVKKSAFAALPSTGRSCVFSPDGTYLAVAHDNSPYITVYKRDGDSFTKLSGIGALPGIGYGCAFSPDGTYLAVGHSGSPCITVYKRDSDSFTKLSALAALPSDGRSCAFSPDGTYLAVAHYGSPCITVYQKDIHEPLQEYNVVFDDPPAAGAVITANYEVPYIPKDSNHILDLQFSIQWV